MCECEILHGWQVENYEVELRSRIRSARDLGTYATFGGVTWSSDLLPTCTKLNSRAASRAWMASFTRVRGTKFERKLSTSPSSTATTQSRYFETNAESASGTEMPTPSRTTSGAQRDNSSHTDPSSTV